jgi:phospholipase C
MRLRIALAAGSAIALAAGLALAIGLPAQGRPLNPHKSGLAQVAVAQGIHKIKHVIVIIQENRSFDDYFGSWPKVGIPPGVCVPDPLNGGCIKPYVDHADSNQGGPHVAKSFIADVDGGKMDGFVKEAELKCKGVKPCPTDVMGYHVQSDIPNYWAYAKHFVLNAKMFESDASWSLPAHMFQVSAWSANCKNPNNPMSCVSSLMPNDRTTANPRPFAWTDLTWLLHMYHVSWGYYLDHGAQSPSNPMGVPKIWNPLPGFGDVKADHQEANIQLLRNFKAEAKAGTLPALSWIVPDAADSEHPPALISRGQAYVTRLINAVMSGPDWDSSAIFLAWDDWGGFYDNVVPPHINPEGDGIRVAAMVISPYAKAGYVDDQPLNSNSYLKFIEDDFLGGARLNPNTDGRPDSRPFVADQNAPNILRDFNFNQKPLPPLILNPCPPTTLTPTPPPGCDGSVALHFKTWGDS